MIEDPKTQAVLLLTVSLGKADRDGTKPLSPGEWVRLTAWLENRGLDLATLMTGDSRDVLSGWNDLAITPDRLDQLLGRGAALGFAMEKWQRAGLWVLARPDPGYPARLARRLGAAAPTVLFGCGARALLNRGGLAVVGSRDASEVVLACSKNLGKMASKEGYSIVSGGARGVDRSAMRGAFAGSGTVVAVLADSLLRAAASALYRRPLLSGDLALISAVNPEARFHVGNAMARNRYIYCLADAAVVMASAHGSGGTWNGACENAKAHWVPLWVKRAVEAGSGNAHLVARGARWLPEPLYSVAGLFERQDAVPELAADSVFEEEPSWRASSPPVPGNLEFFDLFLARLMVITAEEPLPDDRISDRLQVAKGQVKDWIRRGLAEGRIEKVTGPVRYRAPHRAPLLPLAKETAPKAVPAGLDFPNLFIERLAQLSADEARSADFLAHNLDLAPGQVHAWLRHGVVAGRIRKIGQPVRYRAPA